MENISPITETPPEIPRKGIKEGNQGRKSREESKEGSPRKENFKTWGCASKEKSRQIFLHAAVVESFTVLTMSMFLMAGW